MYFISSRATTEKNVTHHSSYWSRYCVLNEWISKTTSFVGSVHHHSDHCQGHYHFHHYTCHLQSLLPMSSSFLHPVWCSLRALMMLKSPKKWKIIPTKEVHKSRVSKCIFHGSRKKINRKPVSRGRKNIDSRIMEKINPHSRFRQSKNAHSRVTKKFRGSSSDTRLLAICWIESVDHVADLCLTNQIYSVPLTEFKEIT